MMQREVCEMTTMVSTYPDYSAQVRDLVEQHRELVEEPLLLAVYYAPDRDTNDVFLFEVLDNFKGSSIEYDGDLLEVLYGATPHFSLPDRDSRLHIVLSSPEELREAATKHTQRFQELKKAFSEGRAEILYHDPEQNGLEKVFQ